MKHRQIYEPQSRFASTFHPSSYNANARTVEAILSKGSEVQRSYGRERLRISTKAVDLGRLAAGIPLLDSHQQVGIANALGQIRRAWLSGDALMGLISFNDTPQGRAAEQMVARGEVRGISIGYIVSQWEVRDADGRILDPERDRISVDADLTFEASRWELLEASLVSVPADASASVRSFTSAQDSAAPRRAPRGEGGQSEEKVDGAKIEANVRKSMLNGLCREQEAQRASLLDDLWLRQILTKDDRARRGVQ